MRSKGVWWFSLMTYVLFENHSQAHWLQRIAAFFVFLFKSMLFFFSSLFVFFNLVTNRCLAHTSRIISQGYTHINYVLPFPFHIILITPPYLEIMLRIVFIISHQNLHLLPQKIEWILTWNYKLIISWTGHFVFLYFLGFLSKHTPFLCVGVGNAFISPGNLTDSSICTVSTSVCCCVSSCTNKTKPPPSPHRVAFHCLVPAMNQTPPRHGDESSASQQQQHLWEVSLVLASSPPSWTPFVFFFFFSNYKSICTNANLSHPLSSPLPLTSLHSDSNPPCQPCCWHGGRRRYSFIASICQ